MNLILKISMNNFVEWKNAFDSHKERAEICDDAKTVVVQVNDQSCIVMLYDVDMEGMQKLMSSEFMINLNEEMNIKNEEMNSFEAFPM